MSKKAQKGFAATEAVLLAVIVILVAFVAWYAFHVKSNTDKNLDKTASTQISPPAAKSKTPATATNKTTAQVITTKTDSSGKSYLADSNGKTLYTYNQDSANKSNCDSSCLAIWPAYKATVSSASLPTNVGTITRSDGSVQYTYKQMPLYYYTGDTTAGQTTGDGVNGFSLATP